MSPLAHNGRLIAHVGTDRNGALTAFDAATGKVQWQWKGQGPGYGSPVLAGPGESPQIVTFSSEKLIGVSAADGKLLWEIPFTTPYTQNAVTPLVVGDLVVYSGLSAPVTAVRVGGGAPQKVWENREIGMYMSSPVLAAGLLHGLSHRNKGQYFSVHPQTGKTVWTSDGRQGENAMMLARGSQVFALNTDSELHLLRASAKGLEHVRKYTVADSPTWAHPAILGNRVLVKDRDSLALWTA
jgi:outer membrane protein assembly factor BamB